MKRFALALTFAALTGTTYLLAQQAGAPADAPPPPPPPRVEQSGPERQGPGQQGPGQGRPRSQLMEALDTDKDGNLSAVEIKNASAALAKLDKNGDGTLSQEEIRPRPPQVRGQDGPQQGRRPQDDTAPPSAVPQLKADQRALLFSGGGVTDPRDRGRPVVLIAGALGVTPDVFRDAFSRVRPAAAGQEPDPEQVRQNKANLMMVLGKHGVTNERLDEVSNYYRYVQNRGESWPRKPAIGYAQIKDGKVASIVLLTGGSGYSSVPSVTIENMPDVALQVKLSYGPDFAKNGSVTAVSPAP